MSTKSILLTAQIPLEMAGLRLDQALAQLFPDYSRSCLQRWISQTKVKVGNAPAKAKQKVAGEEIVTIEANTVCANLPWQAQPITLDIVYEDEELLILNKPAGLVVHPGAGNWEGTVVNALLHYIPDLKNLPRAGLVHRLDKDTSGLLVVAKTLTALTALTKQLSERTIKREYIALVVGEVIAGSTINAPIGRHPHLRTQMAITEMGKPAITHYRVEQRLGPYTLLKVNLETGRTHQIRVHLTSIHHPLIGDKTYNKRFQLPKAILPELAEQLRGFSRQALHAQTLGLIHPASHQYQEWAAPLPNDMSHLIEALRHAYKNNA